jgi:steroid delta-isomerase-like uncharacterized protein
MYIKKNKATCRRFIQQIFNEGDLSSIRDFVSPDSVHHEIGDVPILEGRGPEWLADMIHVYRFAFPDLRIEIEDQIAERDQVVTCLRIQGTQKGPLMGIGASGKTVDVPGIRIDRLAEGKITESWFHWDGLGMLQQIDALPALARNPQTAPWAEKPPSLPALMPLAAVPAQTGKPLPSAAPLRPAA